MLSLFVNAAKLFVAGKLFRDNLAFARQWGLGFAAALLLIVGLGWL